MWLELFWRTRRRCQALFLFALCPSSRLAQQWRPIGPAEAPDVRAILFDGPTTSVDPFAFIALSGSFPRASATPISDDTGGFWFFDHRKLDVVIKIADGQSINGKFWIFIGGLSHLQYFVTVTDTQTGSVRTYTHARGELASLADTSAF